MTLTIRAIIAVCTALLCYWIFMKSIQAQPAGVGGYQLQGAASSPASVLIDVKELEHAVAKYEKAKADKKADTQKAMATAGILSSVFKLLLSILKLLPFARISAWFSTVKGRMTVRYSTLVLGMSSALLANFAFGYDLLDSLIIALSGPGAVAFHEYTDMSSMKKQPS